MRRLMPPAKLLRMERDQILPSEVAKALAARRRKVPGKCAQCGNPFMGLLRRRFCSRACLTKAYRIRHREELNRRRQQHYERQKKGTNPTFNEMDS